MISRRYILDIIIRYVDNNNNIYAPIRVPGGVGFPDVEHLQRVGAGLVGEGAGGARAGDVLAVAVAAPLGGERSLYYSLKRRLSECSRRFHNHGEGPY